MAEVSLVDVVSLGLALKERKAEINSGKTEREALDKVLKYVTDLSAQNEFYEKEIEGRRGRIFILLLAQLRHAEVDAVEGFVADVEESLSELLGEDKDEEDGKDSGKPGKDDAE